MDDLSVVREHVEERDGFMNEKQEFGDSSGSRPRLDKLTYAYCNKRAHRVEHEDDATVPVCKDHARGS